MEYFKFTHRTTGAVTYEAREGRTPSAVAAERPEFMVGITTELPLEAREALGVAVTVGAYVRLRAYGTGYVGKVVKLGPKIAHVKITLAGGAEKTLKRPIAELTVITRF